MSGMFGLSLPHLILLAAIALIVIGPQQLPEVARMVGRFLNDLKRTTNDLTHTLMDARDSTDADLRKAREGSAAPEATPEPIASVPSPKHGSPTPHIDENPAHVDKAAEKTAERSQMSFDLAKESAPDSSSSFLGGAPISTPSPHPDAVARPRPSFTIASVPTPNAGTPQQDSKDKNES
jgi:Sec-independent protein translocase protein TatA